MVVTELFPKKHYAESFKQKIPVSTKGHIYIGDVHGKEDEGSQNTYNYAEAIITQYGSEENALSITELALIEYDSNENLKGYKSVIDYDILNPLCGASLLPSVLVADGENYAYINSGSRQSKIHYYRFETDTIRINRIAFDADYVSVEDLRILISRVFPETEKNVAYCI